MDVDTAELFAATDRSLVRFSVPPRPAGATSAARLPGWVSSSPTNLRAIARENPDLTGVIDRRDFNASEGNQRLLDDNTLARLVSILSEQRLGLADVQPDILGRSYEYLIRKFAERGSSAVLHSHRCGLPPRPHPGPRTRRRGLRPRPAAPWACSSRPTAPPEKLAALGKPLADLRPDDEPNPIHLYRQELQADNVAAGKMNAFIHDIRADIRQGNTMRSPLFLDPDGSLRRFRKIAADPMWNQEGHARRTLRQ